MSLSALIGNISSEAAQVCIAILGGASFIFFVITVLSKRFSPVATVSALFCVFLAIAGYFLIPAMINSGKTTGTKVGGGGGTYGVLTGPSTLASTVAAHGLHLAEAA